MKRSLLCYLLVPLLAGVLGYHAYHMLKPEPDPVALDACHKPQSGPYPGEPVELNLPETTAGFRGERHPLLHGKTQLDLTAHWTTIGSGRYVSEMLHEDVCQFIVEQKPAQKRQKYTERDFSPFLPVMVESVGQTWSLDSNKAAQLLRQFHPSASMHLVAQGRRVGPNGAFAVLRALSPTYLDIIMRVHAEFEITPHAWFGRYPVERIWYTPAYFAGQMIVNRQTGTVEYFRLGIPTDQMLNLQITVGIHGGTADDHDIIRAQRMELLGGNSALPTKDLAWTDSISHAAAHQKLRRVFYKFIDIDWLPFEQVVAAARQQKKPIFAMVLWGSLDDQSC